MVVATDLGEGVRCGAAMRWGGLVVSGVLPVRGEARMSAFGLVGVGGAPDP